MPRRPSGERDTTLLKYKLAEQRANGIFKKKTRWSEIKSKRNQWYPMMQTAKPGAKIIIISIAARRV